jgi:hypothetical protein
LDAGQQIRGGTRSRSAIILNRLKRASLPLSLLRPIAAELRMSSPKLILSN